METISIYQLNSCVWEITLGCCFSCKYCGSRGGKPREKELTTNECLDVIIQLSELGCKRVALIGGEVFMRPDWAVIANALTSKNIKTAIITNGFLFSPQLINLIKATNIESIAVSIDGTEQIHDKFRQKGSFARALKAIDELSINNIPVSVISTLNSENVKDLENLYRILINKKIFAWQLQACSPMGNVRKNNINYEIDFDEVLDFVIKYIYIAPFKVGVAHNIGYFTDMEGYLRGNTSGKAIFRGCTAGLTSVAIDSVGNIRGCESMYDDYFIEGNLREKTLSEIWNSKHTFAYNRNFMIDQLTGKCSTCRMGHLCAGGCRSYNYFTHGKLFESLHCARKE